MKLSKLITSIFRSYRPVTLGDEIQRLRKRIFIEDMKMEKLTIEYFENDGICCPGCGLDGFSEMLQKQERRERWLRILIAKWEKRNDLST